MKRFIILLMAVCISVEMLAAIGTYIPQTYSRSFSAPGMTDVSLWDRIKICRTLDAEDNLFRASAYFNLYKEFDKPPHHLTAFMVRFEPSITIGRTLYHFTIYMDLDVTIEDEKYTVSLRNIRVRTESSIWGICDFEELSQEGLDDRGKAGWFSRKKILKIYKELRPVIKDEFERYCKLIQNAASTPTAKESSWFQSR